MEELVWLQVSLLPEPLLLIGVSNFFKMPGIVDTIYCKIPGFLLENIIINIMKFFKNKLIIIFLIIYFFLLVININAIYVVVGDESRYAQSITNLLDGKIDNNNHPLLAKTIWYFVLYVFYIFTGKDAAIGWRIGTIIISILSLVIFNKILRIYFKPRKALIGTILLALDPLFFSFSRLIQLDIIALFFTLVGLFTILTFIEKKDSKYLYLTALFFGFSLSVKLADLLLALLLPIFLIILKIFTNNKKAIINIIYYYILLILGFLSGNFIYFFKNHNEVKFLKYVYDLIRFQITYNEVSYSHQTSSPLSWFSVPQILTLYRLDWKSEVETIIAFQNPLFFILTLPAIILSIIFIYKKILPNAKAMLIILFMFLIQYLPWFFNIHTTYYYYIIPLLPLIILLVLNLLSLNIFKKYYHILIIFLAIFSIGVFLISYPLLVGIRVSKKYENLIYSYSHYHYPNINSIYCQHCSPRK
jgi:dolichyl-phosphate-mannose--protein O-mannosyl transferase